MKSQFLLVKSTPSVGGPGSRGRIRSSAAQRRSCCLKICPGEDQVLMRWRGNVRRGREGSDFRRTYWFVWPKPCFFGPNSRLFGPRWPKLWFKKAKSWFDKAKWWFGQVLHGDSNNLKNQQATTASDQHVDFTNGGVAHQQNDVSPCFTNFKGIKTWYFHEMVW